MTTGYVQTAYSIYMNPGYEGQLFDLQKAEVVSKAAESSAIPFGRVVSRGTEDNQCVLGGVEPLGVSIRDLARPGAFDGAASVSYLEDQTASVLMAGWIYLKAPAGATAGDAVKYNTTTGVIGAGAAGSGEAELPGATWEKTVGSGAVGPVRIVANSNTVAGS